MPWTWTQQPRFERSARSSTPRARTPAPWQDSRESSRQKDISTLKQLTAAKKSLEGILPPDSPAIVAFDGEIEDVRDHIRQSQPTADRLTAMERQINIHKDKLNKLAADRNELVTDTHSKLKKIDSRRNDINDKIEKLRIEQKQLEDDTSDSEMKDDSDKGRLQEDGYSSYSSLPSAAVGAPSITEASATEIEHRITARLENMLDGKMNQLYILMQQNNAQAHAHHPHQHGGQPPMAPVHGHAPPSPSATQGLATFQPGPVVTPRGSPAPSGKSTPRTKVATPHFDKKATTKIKDKAKDKDDNDVVSIGDLDDDNELERLKSSAADAMAATGEPPSPP